MKVWVVSDKDGVMNICATKEVAKEYLTEIIHVAHIEGCMDNAEFRMCKKALREWESRVNWITHEETLDIGQYEIREMTVKS